MPNAHMSVGDRVPRLLCDFELHWPLSLLLHDNRAGPDMATLNHVVDAKADKIAATQLAFDGEIEQCELAGSMIKL